MKTIILSEEARAQLQRYARKQPAASPSSTTARRPVVIVRRKDGTPTAASPQVSGEGQDVLAAVLDSLLDGMRAGNSGDKAAVESLLKALYNGGVPMPFYEDYYRKYQDALSVFESVRKNVAAPGDIISQAVMAGTRRLKIITQELGSATRRIMGIHPQDPEPAQ